jgi:hypothetical protein
MITCVFPLLCALVILPGWAADSPWKSPLPGLQLGTFSITVPADTVRAEFRVAKIDPRRFSLVFLSQKDHGPQARTARQWCADFKLAAVINAGMYGPDFLTHTGYVKSGNRLHNPRFNAKYGAFLAFDPATPQLPAVQIIDKQLQDWKTLVSQYRTVVQNFRLVSLEGSNVWTNPGPAHSTAALALAKSGEVLLIFCARPLSTDVFTRMILELPLGVRNAMYLEGGVQASLSVPAGGSEWDLSGIDNFFQTAPGPAPASPLPVVIGVRKR